MILVQILLGVLTAHYGVEGAPWGGSVRTSRGRAAWAPTWLRLSLTGSWAVATAQLPVS
jgi:hypothetical protein